MRDHHGHAWDGNTVPLSPAEVARGPAGFCRIERLQTAQVAQAARLPELCPPDVLPRGNVGTPLADLRGLIRSCRLPPRVIAQVNDVEHGASLCFGCLRIVPFSLVSHPSPLLFTRPLSSSSTLIEDAGDSTVCSLPGRCAPALHLFDCFFLTD